MNIEELRKEIRVRGFAERITFVGEEGYWDGFNLRKRSDGKWESSYVEKGYPYDRREYENEEDATKGFLELLEGNCPRQKVKPLSFFERRKLRRRDK